MTSNPITYRHQFDAARANLRTYTDHPSTDSDVRKVAEVQATLAVAEALHWLADAVRNHQEGPHTPTVTQNVQVEPDAPAPADDTHVYRVGERITDETTLIMTPLDTVVADRDGDDWTHQVEGWTTPSLHRGVRTTDTLLEQWGPVYVKSLPVAYLNRTDRTTPYTFEVGDASDDPEVLDRVPLGATAEDGKGNTWTRVDGGWMAMRITWTSQEVVPYAGPLTLRSLPSTNLPATEDAKVYTTYLVRYDGRQCVGWRCDPDDTTPWRVTRVGLMGEDLKTKWVEDRDGTILAVLVPDRTVGWR